MRQLMISLDKSILNPSSPVAERMREYGETDELFILIPAREVKSLNLSPTVHVQSTGGNKIQQFFRLLKLGKGLIRQKEIHALTTQDPLFTGLVGVLLKRETKAVVEVQLHGDFFSSTYYRHGSIKQQIQYHLGKWVIKHADRLRAVGERVRQSLLQLGITEEKIYVQPVLVDTTAIQKYIPHFDLHRSFPKAEKIFVVMSRLDPVKNIVWLVEIFSKIVEQKSNYLLIIVGTGSEEKKIRSKIKDLRLQDNVKLEGWSGDPWSYLKTADALLFPSLSEGYGLAAMEAFAAGCPIIMTDVGVAHYELKPNPRIIIVPINKKFEFIKNILSL